MLIRDEKEKKEVMQVLRGFLIMNGTSMRKLCMEKGLNPQAIHQRLSKGYMHIDQVNRLIQMTDDQYVMKKIGQKWMVVNKKMQ